MSPRLHDVHAKHTLLWRLLELVFENTFYVPNRQCLCQILALSHLFTQLKMVKIILKSGLEKLIGNYCANTPFFSTSSATIRRFMNVEYSVLVYGQQVRQF